MTQLKPTSPSLLLLAAFSLLLAGCKGLEPTYTYHKDRLSFSLYEDWRVSSDSDDIIARHIYVHNTGITQIVVKIHRKYGLMVIPEYQEYDTSLKEFAARYNENDIAIRSRTPQPITQSPIRRRDVDGLKETQKFLVDVKGEYTNRDSIHEFYRFDTRENIIFVALDASGDEYESSEAALELILTSLHYY